MSLEHVHRTAENALYIFSFFGLTQIVRQSLPKSCTAHLLACFFYGLPFV